MRGVRRREAIGVSTHIEVRIAARPAATLLFDPFFVHELLLRRSCGHSKSARLLMFGLARRRATRPKPRRVCRPEVSRRVERYCA